MGTAEVRKIQQNAAKIGLHQLRPETLELHLKWTFSIFDASSRSVETRHSSSSMLSPSLIIRGSVHQLHRHHRCSVQADKTRNAPRNRLPPSLMHQLHNKRPGRSRRHHPNLHRHSMKQSQQSVSSSKLKSEVRRYISKRKPTSVHHTVKPMLKTLPTPSSHRSRSSNRARQCAQYLYTALGWRPPPPVQISAYRRATSALCGSQCPRRSHQESSPSPDECQVASLNGPVAHVGSRSTNAHRT